MHYLLCRHRVEDFERWHRIFASHAEAQRASGLHLLYLLHEPGDPNSLVYLFRVDDLEKMRAFTESPEAAEAGRASRVIGVPEITLLTD